MKHTMKMQTRKEWGVSGPPRGAGRIGSIPRGITALAQT